MKEGAWPKGWGQWVKGRAQARGWNHRRRLGGVDSLVGAAYRNYPSRFQFKLSPTSHSPPPPRAAETLVTASASAPVPIATTAQAPTPAPAPVPSSAPASTALTLEEELQEAIRRAQVRVSGPRASDRMRLESQVHATAPCPQLLPNRGIDDILEDQVEPEGKSRTPRFEEKGDGVQGSGFLGLREEWPGDLDSWKGQIGS